MGFLTRRLIPRKVRRLAHPVRAAKRATKKALIPKPVRKALWGVHVAANPVSSAGYALERSIFSKPRKSKGRAVVYRHGSCQVKHRTPEAALKCRNR